MKKLESIKKLFIALTIIILLQTILVVFVSSKYNYYHKVACVESDIIRVYHDFVNDTIYSVAENYLNCIDLDTNELNNYSYMY